MNEEAGEKREVYIPKAKTMLVTAVKPFNRLVSTVACTTSPGSLMPIAIIVTMTAEKILAKARKVS